jgi:disulfide bond formation protein DsbB
MSMPLSFRSACLLGFAVCAGLMGYALYAQHGLGLEPCPLCILQRIAVIATGVVFLVAGLHAPRSHGRWVYALAAFTTAATGAGVASRHVWLQSLPADQVPACGPGYDYMMEAFPFAEALKMIFSGSGECAEVDWTFLGQSMPVWTLAAFIGLAIWALAGAAITRRSVD